MKLALLCLLAALPELVMAAAPTGGPATAAEACARDGTWAVALHGGAFDGREPSVRQLAFLKQQAEQLGAALAGGASSLTVVERGVRALEDSGLYNAGRGAIHNRDGVVETDAALMNGRTLQAGAVASMVGLKNPIAAARLVMEQTRHVLLVGDRGREHLLKLGAEAVAADYFLNTGRRGEVDKGTVGAVARDRCGDLAAATSTGGYDVKIPGRVGDVPVIGAGTYARNGVAAISATGHGEYFIRYTAAASVAARIRFGGMAPAPAARAVLEEMAEAAGDKGGRGGLLVVTADGRVTTPFTSVGLLRAVASDRVPAYAAAVDDPPTVRPE